MKWIIMTKICEDRYILKHIIWSPRGFNWHWWMAKRNRVEMICIEVASNWIESSSQALYERWARLFRISTEMQLGSCLHLSYNWRNTVSHQGEGIILSQNKRIVKLCLIWVCDKWLVLTEWQIYHNHLVTNLSVT